MRSGVRIGVDVGKARIGVARTDLHGMLATPVETVPRSSDGSDLARIREIAAELDAFEYVVGLPLSMSGGETASTQDARDFAVLLADGGIPVRMIDERLSTVSAQAALHRSGRNTRTSRPVIDQVAAVILVQHALDSERSSGNPPGILIAPSQGKGRD
ncbi:Holliday junction resolvase RuvX [Herbiconiux sp. CPCC 203407]|uniref:Putative pre-16S rRNA nuclease n=1 Tax=Herbiconiux oxytropis TaxID=2970915 RepID=A0AA42BT49_9MICO|nr:Holliday junction resolvase RuvX [Herbiconiux oxytropis]MCS5720432.1 Holliday junction resolvase RuvX [Herbiconiux oxytropis]MCS5726005.1 Holliday junction resolvase RuvX [Herbiconiux oxytropis]